MRTRRFSKFWRRRKAIAASTFGGSLGEIQFAVFGLEDFLHPGAGVVNALVLLPEACGAL